MRICAMTPRSIGLVLGEQAHQNVWTKTMIFSYQRLQIGMFDVLTVLTLVKKNKNHRYIKIVKI